MLPPLSKLKRVGAAKTVVIHLCEVLVCLLAYVGEYLVRFQRLGNYVCGPADGSRGNEPLFIRVRQLHGIGKRGIEIRVAHSVIGRVQEILEGIKLPVSGAVYAAAKRHTHIVGLVQVALHCQAGKQLEIGPREPLAGNLLITGGICMLAAQAKLGAPFWLVYRPVQVGGIDVLAIYKVVAFG